MGWIYYNEMLTPNRAIKISNPVKKNCNTIFGKSNSGLGNAEQLCTLGVLPNGLINMLCNWKFLALEEKNYSSCFCRFVSDNLVSGNIVQNGLT